MEEEALMNDNPSSADGSSGALAGTKRPPEETDDDVKSPTTAPPEAKKAASVTATATSASSSSTTQQLQQQIQQQLQQQLQAQLQAAAARGQQANITPEQIQAQAQAMVQAAAQAQAVVAAAKSRGDGLVPMNATQIAALSQIQAQAIVHARNKTTANNGGSSSSTPQQVQTQIQLQAQALVHAHTQAQIQAGIYKGDTGGTAKTDKAAAPVATSTAAVAAASATAKAAPTTTGTVPSPLTNIAAHPDDVVLSTTMATALPTSTMPASGTSSSMDMSMDPASSVSQHVVDSLSMGTSDALIPSPPQPSANSPQFLAQLNTSLNAFWQRSFAEIQNLQDQTEHDFKNHNDLPLARIKRIMKSDEDVRMISAEAPVLFAKACELFILDLSIRSWNYSQLHKRRTLQKEDVREAIQKTDIFDFLVDVIH